MPPHALAQGGSSAAHCLSNSGEGSSYSFSSLVLGAVSFTATMWNCDSSYENATWWDIRPVVCSLWAQSPAENTTWDNVSWGSCNAVNDTNTQANGTEEAHAAPAPEATTTTTPRPGEAGDGSTSWFTLNWFWSTGWSTTFGGSGVFPTGLQWLLWCVDQLGTGILGRWWEHGKTAGSAPGKSWELFMGSGETHALFRET